MKKEWSKPKLIRLYSGRPEEAVLTSCQVDGGQSSTSPGLWDCGGGNECSEQVAS